MPFVIIPSRYRYDAFYSISKLPFDKHQRVFSIHHHHHSIHVYMFYDSFRIVCSKRIPFSSFPLVFRFFCVLYLALFRWEFIWLWLSKSGLCKYTKTISTWVAIALCCCCCCSLVWYARVNVFFLLLCITKWWCVWYRGARESCFITQQWILSQLKSSSVIASISSRFPFEPYCTLWIFVARRRVFRLSHPIIVFSFGAVFGVF